MSSTTYAKRPRWSAVLLLLLAGAGLACGQDNKAELDQNKRRFPPGFKVERYHWTGSVEEGRLIEGRNPYGNIRSRTSSDEEVEVTAQIQKLRPDQPEVEFVIEETEQGLVVAVGRAAFEMAELGDGPGDGFPGRIDLTILVPEDNPLKAQTVDGDIIIDGDEMANDVEAIARDGNITVVTRGSVKASTGRGNVKASLAGKVWSRPQALQTTTGKIEVEMLDFADLAVSARTTGEIRTQFPDGVSPAVKRSTNALEYALGRGETPLTVTSDRGIVELSVVKKITAAD